MNHTHTFTQEVTHISGERLTTSVVVYPNVEDILGLLARSVAREKTSGKVAYVSPSAPVRAALFLFAETL